MRRELDRLRGRRRRRRASCRPTRRRAGARARDRSIAPGECADARERVEEPLLRERRRAACRPSRTAGRSRRARAGRPASPRPRPRARTRGRAVWPERAVAGVQEDEPVGAPRRLVLADHQLARAGDARPVDPTEVVALLVLAHRVVLLAGAEEVACVREAPTFAPNAASGVPVEVLDLGCHEQVLALVELQSLAHQGERVGDVHRERPELVAAAGLRQDRVGDPLGAVRPGSPRRRAGPGGRATDGSRSSSSRNDVAAAERFSTSMCTVTRVPGATRMSERRRWTAIRWRPQRTKSAAIAAAAPRGRARPPPGPGNR